MQKPDQLTDRARKVAEEICDWTRHQPKVLGHQIISDGERLFAYADIIERHWREILAEKNRDAEKSRQFNESEIRRFEENHKEDAPCPVKSR